MRNYAADGTTTRSPSYTPSGKTRSRERRIEPIELAEWVEGRLDRLASRWLQELQGRPGATDDPVNGILDEFVGLLVRFLPAILGPYRDQVEPLWAQGAELFGAVGARRGLAAGEIIEEFQILREGVIRLLYQDPPLGGRVPLSLREVLRLNRALDRGVTHASIGHTDALFFSLFEGSGTPDPVTRELIDEARKQLDEIREELRSILGRLPGEGFLSHGATGSDEPS